MTEINTYPLQLPGFLQKAVSEFAAREGTSVDQFISIVVAEKLSALDTQSFFEKRANRADMRSFDAIMSRPGGEPPRPGDEMLP